MGIAQGEEKMSKFKFISLAASVAFALAFTISCSGGDDNNDGGGGTSGGSNLSDLPKNIYLIVGYDDNDNAIKEEYKGNGDIKVRIPVCTNSDGVKYYCKGHSDYDSDDNLFYNGSVAGKIQNGQVLLEWPDIDSKYLGDKEAFCGKWGECNISIIPENLAFSFIEQPYIITTPDKGDCNIGFVLVGEANGNLRGWRDAGFIYSSKHGKITGASSSNFDLDLSKGWNAFYSYNDVNGKKNNTTSLSKTGGKAEWWIECDD
jgi:hypothetical protein